MTFLESVFRLFYSQMVIIFVDSGSMDDKSANFEFNLFISDLLASMSEELAATATCFL